MAVCSLNWFSALQNLNVQQFYKKAVAAMDRISDYGVQIRDVYSAYILTTF